VAERMLTFVSQGRRRRKKGGCKDPNYFNILSEEARGGEGRKKH